jgi:hypothetical protein
VKHTGKTTKTRCLLRLGFGIAIWDLDWASGWLREPGFENLSHLSRHSQRKNTMMVIDQIH